MAGKVGFIGLGNMGGPMALNLVKADFALVVHDIDAGKVERLIARGAAKAESAQAVAAATDRTVCIVETTAQAQDVIAGEHGIIKRAAAGHIVVCMSTIDPFVAQRLGEQLAARGIAMLDAPVSGGTERAATGELSIIAGGAKETFAACEDIFRAMGKNLFHVGTLGQGLAMKLVNNMLVQVNTVAVAEALVLGVKAGLDPSDDLRRGSREHGHQLRLRVARAEDASSRLLARRHRRHLVQGSGARDRVREAARRPAAPRQRHAAGVPDGPSGWSQ